MKQFFKIVFASTLGVLIASGIMFVGAIIFLIGLAASGSSNTTFTPEDNSVFKISLSGELAEQSSSNPIADLFGEKNDKVSLQDLIKAIRKAKNNDKIKGIYIDVDNINGGYASLQALRKELVDFKESGKFIASYADAYTQKAYYVASVADSIFLNPQGGVALIGMASQGIFFTGLEEKLGVDVEIFKVGTYKSAVEPYILKKFSEPNREQINSYMGSIWSTITNAVAESRGISLERLNEYIDGGYAIGVADNAIDFRLADKLYYRFQAENAVANMASPKKDGDSNDKKNKLKAVSLSNVLAISEKEKSSKNKIAVLYAEGEIEEGESSSSPMSYDEATITCKTADELRKLQEDDDVKAVVMRVNSPGGSAFVSEQIWKAVEDLKQQKPIMVSMGDYAASGGYYISCAADRIFAEPTTLTGSIGVFGILYNVEGLLNKIGITTDMVKTNKFSDLGDISRPMDESEKVLIQRSVENTYKLFLERCADGRGMTVEQIDSIGQGRVWSGEQALELGLVDALGGLDDAIKMAALFCDLDDYEVTSVSTKKDFWDMIFDSTLDEVQARILKSNASEEYKLLKTVSKLKSTNGIMARMPYVTQ